MLFYLVQVLYLAANTEVTPHALIRSPRRLSTRLPHTLSYPFQVFHFPCIYFDGRELSLSLIVLSKSQLRHHVHWAFCSITLRTNLCLFGFLAYIGHFNAWFNWASTQISVKIFSCVNWEAWFKYLKGFYQRFTNLYICINYGFFFTYALMHNSSFNLPFLVSYLPYRVQPWIFFELNEY